MTANASLIIGITFGFTIGAIYFGYGSANAKTANPCLAVSQAYDLSAPTYRKQIGLRFIPEFGLYEHEILGMGMAQAVADTYGVRGCLVLAKAGT